MHSPDWHYSFDGAVGPCTLNSAFIMTLIGSDGEKLHKESPDEWEAPPWPQCIIIIKSFLIEIDLLSSNYLQLTINELWSRGCWSVYSIKPLEYSASSNSIDWTFNEKLKYLPSSTRKTLPKIKLKWKKIFFVRPTKTSFVSPENLSLSQENDRRNVRRDC